MSRAHYSTLLYSFPTLFTLQLKYRLKCPHKRIQRSRQVLRNKFDETAWMEVVNNGLVTAITIGLLQTRVLVGAARILLPLDVPEAQGVP
jgi:hypothetical protein